MALCQCGCGQETRVVKSDDRKHGLVKGQTMRFMQGHYRRSIPSPICKWGHEIAIVGRNRSGGCKACIKAQTIARRAANPEEANIWAKRRRDANPEKTHAKQNARRAANPEKFRAQANMRYAADPEKFRAYSKAHRIAHPESVLVSNSIYRARKRAAPINDLTANEWMAIKAHYGNRCIYCGIKSKRLSMDHIIPLSKNGSHTVSNIVPACKSCNSKKRNKGPLIPVQPLLFIVVDEKAS